MDFRKMRGEADLHVFLGCSTALAERLLRDPDHLLFKQHRIPKKGRRGGVREVWEVRDTKIADVYKGLSRKLDEFFAHVLTGYPHDGAQAYVRGRSILTNARRHIGAKRVLRADIRDFFASISEQHVVVLLRALGMGEEAARTLAVVVARTNHLPLGIHTSPALANAVCHDLDRRLEALVPGGRYSRYADDLAFSGPSLPTKEAVARELAKDGFALAEEKWRLARAGRGLYVTGLSLEDGRDPRAPRDLKRRIRQDLRHADRHGLEHHIGRRGYPSVQSGINKIHGTIQFLRGIERKLGESLHAKWIKILTRSGREVSYVSAGPAGPRDIVFLLDESVVDGPAGKLLVLALCVVEDPDVVRTALSALLDDRLADPHTTTPSATLVKEGLHWNSLAPDDRTRTTECARALPFRCFIGFASLPAEDKRTYDGVYRRLLDKLMESRFVKYDGCRVSVLAEENSKVRGSTLSDAVKACYDRLTSQASRRPLALPSSAVVKKRADAALPLPDLVLGIFVDYARSRMQAAGEQGAKKKQAPGAQAESRFEQVRDRVRAIYDMDTGVVYSRRRPFEPWKGSPTRPSSQVVAPTMPFAKGDLVALTEDIPILKLAEGATGLVLKVIPNTSDEGYWFYELLIKDGHHTVEGRRLQLVRHTPLVPFT